jgi:hypothetical protein
MSSDARRAAARRRAWGRGPYILRFEPLEGRLLLSTAPASSSGTPELVVTSFNTDHDLAWGDTFQASGVVENMGTAATTVPVNVAVYASTSTTPGTDAVYVGATTVPAGLAPGATAPFSQQMQAPPTPLSDIGNATSYNLDPVVDPTNAAGLANPTLPPGQSTPYSVVTIVPHAASNLQGNSLTLNASMYSWGGQIALNAQVANNGQGSAPSTRARVVLTPFGQTPGGSSDFTIGSITVPALGAYQTTNVSGTVTLPSVPPTVLNSATAFTLSLIQDADYQTTSPLSQPALQGIGTDQAVLQIFPTGTTTATATRPDLSVANLSTSTTSLTWGQPFQVTTTVQNAGQADAGAFVVRMLVVDANRPTATPLALVDVAVPSLKAGTSQQITQSLTVQGALPAGLAASDIAGRVIVQIDPEHAVDRVADANDSATSGPLTVGLIQAPGSSSSAPTSTTTTTTTTAATTTPAPTQTTQTHSATTHTTPVRAARRRIVLPKHTSRPRLRVIGHPPRGHTAR